MKMLMIILMLLISSLAIAAEPLEGGESANPGFIKNWFAGLGPVISNALVGVNGTKYGIELGYEQGLSERWDLRYFYNGCFNTGSQGSSALTSIGVASRFFFGDRLAETAPYLRVDVSYGGANRATDANAIFGGAAGLDFFRTQKMTAELEIREFAMPAGTSSSPTTWPSATELTLGVLF